MSMRSLSLWHVLHSCSAVQCVKNTGRVRTEQGGAARERFPERLSEGSWKALGRFTYLVLAAFNVRDEHVFDLAGVQLTHLRVVVREEGDGRTREIEGRWSENEGGGQRRP